MIPFSVDDLKVWLVQFGADFTTFTQAEQVTIILLTAILAWIVCWFTCSVLYKLFCRINSNF